MKKREDGVCAPAGRLIMEWIRKDSTKKMQINEAHGVTWLTFPLLEKTRLVKHGFSTRLGGVSRGIFSSMNLSFQRGDEPQHVLENYRRMAEVLGSRTENMVFSRQTHTANIRVVTKEDRGKGIHRETDYEEVDGLVTNEPGIMLVTSYADCVPIYLIDTVHRAVGLCHSGWKGTVAKISQHAILVMNKEYGTCPQDIVAAVGPSICQDCYEVSTDVAEAFRHVMDEKDLDKIMMEKPNGKYQLDLWMANRMWLEEAGVLPENIQVTDICTCCNPDKLFSHRASQGKRGNLAAFLEITG